MITHYPEEIIDEVRSSNDIVEVVSQYVHLKRSGRNFFGCCPFHNEKTPSFSVSPEKQIYHCFGCNEGGNVINFIMKIENISFVEAIQLLAKRARIELPEANVSDDYKKKKSQKEEIIKVNTEAAKFFYSNLIGEKGAAAREYIQKRGLDTQTVKRFGLGYSLDQWDALYKHLLDKGYSQDIIYYSGLVKKAKNSSYIDTFKNRLIFPIFDTSSNIIGFGGRTMDNSLPKYLNSPETAVFNKSKNLYGLNISKNTKSGKLIIVEGYMDVIALHQYGIDYAVASLGTALTEGQGKLLKRYGEEVIFAYDSDTSGQAATLRGIEILNNLECNIKILQLPEGKDPDEYIRKNGADKFNYLINHSKTYVQFKIDLTKKQYNLDTVDGKISFLNKISTMLSQIENTIERDAYINLLSNETGLSSDSIIAQINKKLYKNSGQLKDIKKQEIPRAKEIIFDKSLDDAEKMLINLISNEDIYKNYKDLIKNDIFTYEIIKNIAVVVIDKLEQNKEIDPSELMTKFNDSEEVGAISKIFSINTDFEEREKAIKDCINFINNRKEQIKKKEILKDLANNPEKLIELDKLIRARDKKSGQEGR